MGLVFVETLPPKARAVLRSEDNAQRLTLPVHTDIYRFTQYHEPQQPQPLWQRLLRSIPGFGNVGCHKVRGWGLEKNTTRVGHEGNLVTLGGVDAKGVNRDLQQLQSPSQEEIPFWSPDYMVAAPLCGVISTLGSAQRAGRTCGSFSNTSSPAPAMMPRCRASARACSSTTLPRAVLISMAWGCMPRKQDNRDLGGFFLHMPQGFQTVHGCSTR